MILDYLSIILGIIGIAITVKSYETYQLLPIKKEGKTHRQKLKEERYVRYFGIFLILLGVGIFLFSTINIIISMMNN